MFTGIVEEVGTVRTLDTTAGAVSLSIQASLVRDGLALGDSVSINGACLTATDLDAHGFTVGLSPETLRRTALGRIVAGTRVNLERAVSVGDRLGGHYVQGHVDGVVTIVGIRPEGDSLIVSFEAPPELAPYIVEKGFVALDGISLTVSERIPSPASSPGGRGPGDSSFPSPPGGRGKGEGGIRFSVALIAYTQDHVALTDKAEGDAVNLEVDIIAKYVESILGSRVQGTGYR
jgi:riboflavin synthase